MKTTSLVLGILSIFGMLFAFIPCLGIFNWLNIPFAMIGLIISILAYNEENESPKGNAIGGIVMCAIAIFFGSIRLIIGGGIF
jgi:uncharacterized membrane protein